MLPLRRTLVVGAGAGALVLASATAASAHVTASPSEVPAGGSTVIEFSTSHGCDGSPTTQISIQIPEGVTSVRPTVVPDWSVEITTETLDEPIDDGHGNQITERTSVVTYTAMGAPLEDGLRQVWPVAMRMPDTEGERLAFPVVQTCVEGETAWISIPEEGAEEPDTPAPVVVLAASTGDGHGSGSTGDSGSAGDAGSENGAATSADGAGESGGDGDGTGLAVVALVVGALGLGAGGTALVRGRR